MSIHHHHFDRNFTILPNSLLQDDNLSLRDLGLLVRMLSMPGDWKFSVCGLNAIVSQDGLHSIRSSLEKLEECGYLSRGQVRQRGQFAAGSWELSDLPIFVADSRKSDCGAAEVQGRKRSGDKAEAPNEEFGNVNEKTPKMVSAEENSPCFDLPSTVKPITVPPITVNPTQTKYLSNKEHKYKTPIYKKAEYGSAREKPSYGGGGRRGPHTEESFAEGYDCVLQGRTIMEYYADMKHRRQAELAEAEELRRHPE